MSQQELLKHVIQVLDRAGIPYMLTGSMVSSLQGEPRSTHDIDLVAAVPKSAAKHLAAAFPPPNFYLDENSILDAIKQHGMFNVIDVTTSDKIDFWLLTSEPFDQSRFPRKRTVDFMGCKMHVSAPEDTILAKLRWAQLSGGSEKQFIDALRVYEVQHKVLDLEYIKDWVEKLNIELLWKRLTEEADKI